MSDDRSMYPGRGLPRHTGPGQREDEPRREPEGEPQRPAQWPPAGERPPAGEWPPAPGQRRAPAAPGRPPAGSGGPSPGSGGPSAGSGGPSAGRGAAGQGPGRGSPPSGAGGVSARQRPPSGYALPPGRHAGAGGTPDRPATSSRGDPSYEGSRRATRPDEPAEGYPGAQRGGYADGPYADGPYADGGSAGGGSAGYLDRPGAPAGSGSGRPSRSRPGPSAGERSAYRGDPLTDPLTGPLAGDDPRSGYPGGTSSYLGNGAPGYLGDPAPRHASEGTSGYPAGYPDPGARGYADDAAPGSGSGAARGYAGDDRGYAGNDRDYARDDRGYAGGDRGYPGEDPGQPGGASHPAGPPRPGTGRRPRGGSPGRPGGARQDQPSYQDPRRDGAYEGAYQDGAYETGAYQDDPYRDGAYRDGPRQDQDAYQRDAYQSEAPRRDRYGDERGYPDQPPSRRRGAHPGEDRYRDQAPYPPDPDQDYGGPEAGGPPWPDDDYEDDRFVPGLGGPRRRSRPDEDLPGEGRQGQDEYAEDDYDEDEDERPRRRGTKAARGGGKRRRSRWVAPLIAVLVILVPIVIGGVIGLRFVLSKYYPADYSTDGTGSTVVEVQSGQTAASVGQRLVTLGVVASARAFELAAEHNPNSRGLEPGFYRLHRHMKASLAYALMLSPAARVQNKITIPEGWRLSQILAELGAHSGIPAADFQKALASPAALGLPSYAGNKPEGYLFPATYEIQPNMTATVVLKNMVRQFNAEAAHINLTSAAAKANMTQAQVITVASLLQAEGGKISDYPKIARVIYNRLNRGMPLQFDSTVLYGLGKFGTTVTEKQIQTPTPYNTYMHKGLPPGPIDSPGNAAILAALHPAAGNWLYFIANKSGVTKFSDTLAGLNG